MWLLVSRVLALLASQAIAMTDTKGLWRVERANAAACIKWKTKIEATLAAVPIETRGVVTIAERSSGTLFGGGLGNELNILTHAALVALALNRSLCAHRSANSPTLRLMASPVLNASRDPNRLDACKRLSHRSVMFPAVPSDANIAVVVPRLNWTPMSLENPDTRTVASRFGSIYESALGCLHNALYRPGPLVRGAAAPYLQKLRTSMSLGVHLRTHDLHMARYQQYKGKSKRKQRPGCLRPLELATALGKAPRCGEETKRITLFVAADHEVNKTHWDLAAATAVVTTSGHPAHTGRPYGRNTSPYRGTRKALVDFFLLTEADHFVSNCPYTCSGEKCRSTFAFNVHIHRSPKFGNQERLAPEYKCPNMPHLAQTTVHKWPYVVGLRDPDLEAVAYIPTTELERYHAKYLDVSSKSAVLQTVMGGEQCPLRYSDRWPRHEGSLFDDKTQTLHAPGDTNDMCKVIEGAATAGLLPAQASARHGLTLLDVGAAFSGESILGHKLGFQVIAFEARESEYSQIIAATRRFRHVEVLHAAVTDRSGPVTLNMARDSSSLLKSAVEGVREAPKARRERQKTMTVPGVTLDEVVAERGLKIGAGSASSTFRPTLEWQCDVRFTTKNEVRPRRLH